MSAKIEQKELSHETILQSAARLLRERGIAGARVADVMKGAGLTVGGFYSHFVSKTELIDEALRRTATELRARLWKGLDAKPAADRAEVLLKRYLSAAHRDLMTDGCPLPAVVGEIGTTAPEHKEVLAELLGELAEGLAKELDAEPQAQQRSSHAERRQRALAVIALMFGGLSLSRALRGTGLSDDILKACRAVGAAVVRGAQR
jgi:TetR/AcrR family transcriptional repressor of nem operon